MQGKAGDKIKMYYVANARMPSEKAHGIQIAKMCEAFIEEGIDLVLVVPRRFTDARSVSVYYGLRVEVPVVRLPVFDWYAGGRVGYFLSSVSFMVSYSFFIWRKKIMGERCVLYTVDTDNYSSSPLALFGLPLFSEMHGAKFSTVAQRMLFKAARGIIAINSIIVDELRHTFPRAHARYVVLPNGVDLSAFKAMDMQDARRQLGLAAGERIVLYTGRFFDWKGLEILPQAAALTPEVRWQVVGGEKQGFSDLVTESLPQNLFFAGSRPHSEMPLWFAAADALLVLGTKRDVQSFRYTSPMKLFEYLAVERLIIASNTPAIREIVSEKEVLFYEPDMAADLARVVEYATMRPLECTPLVEAAAQLAKTHSWNSRATRIVQLIPEAPVSPSTR